MDTLNTVLVCGVFWSIAIMSVSIEAAKLPELRIDKAVALSPSDIFVSWTPSLVIKRGKVKYVVRYKVKGGKPQTIPVYKPEVTLKGLSGDTTYVIAVRALKGKSRGDWSNTVDVKTDPKLKLLQGDTLLEGKLAVNNIDTDSAVISWNLTTTTDNVKGFKGFRVILKNKGKKNELDAAESRITLPGLQPDTTYTANVYVLKKSGSRIKLGAVKFTTLDEPFRAPKNIRIKSVTDRTMDIKWRHLKNNPDSHVAGYTLQYKRRGNLSSGICTFEIDNSTKTQLIEGLLPDAKYSVRIAGLYENTTGPFTDWLKVRTEHLNNNITDIRLYHISPREVMLLWKPFSENAMSSLEVMKVLAIGDPWELHSHRIPVNVSGMAILDDLIPDTPYRVVVRESSTVTCDKYIAAEFRTIAGDCFDDCLLDSASSQNKSVPLDYTPFLRIIPLPAGNHLVTWSPYFIWDNNITYIYVIRIFGEPFMSIMSTFVIPIGRTYHVVKGLDIGKTYSINLQVFDPTMERAAFLSTYLLVLPSQDLVPGTGIPITTDDASDVWVPTSMDILVKQSFLQSKLTDEQLDKNETGRNSIDEAVFAQTDETYMAQIDGTEWIQIAKSQADEEWYIDVTQDAWLSTSVPSFVNDSLNYARLKQVPPSIQVIMNITVRDGQPVHISCLSSGDPYPSIAWVNVTANDHTVLDASNYTAMDTSNHIVMDTGNRVSMTSPRYVGSTSQVNQRAYLGTNRFLDIDPVELSDNGIYACVAENNAGKDFYFFHIFVIPKPPGPVQHLISLPTTPFEIFVQWLPPDSNTPSVLYSPVIGYHIVVLDEYEVMMKEMNTTETKINIKDFQPNTKYKILVSAYHEISEGSQMETIARTKDIPVLGSPENITVSTYNGSTLQVAWSSPIVVRTRQVKLRTYLIRHRKLGDQKAKEVSLDKYTNVSIIALEREQRYEVQVLAMSEDAQVSFSEWIQGSTFRETYMDESRPPPPPQNVYLRQEAGNVIVSWLPPFPDENILVRGYAIDVLNNGTRRESMELVYKESSVIVYEVEMGILYQISVKAKNNAGTSIDEWAEIYIPEKYVSQHPVQNFGGHALSSTKLELQWEPPIKGEYSHYVLSYTIAGDKGPALPGGGDVPANILNYIVRSLKPYTDYFFQITPYLNRVKGISSNTTVKTLSDRPTNPPENITLIPLNSTALLIRCAPPKTGKNGRITTYKMSYRTRHTFRSDVILPAEDDENLNGVMTELLPSTAYEFRVRALTINGSGPWSTWFQTRTLAPMPVLPKAPRDLETLARATSIRVSWSSPDQDTDHITGYIVAYGRFIPEVYRYSLTKDTYTHTLDSLEKGSVYIVSVRAFNEHGESEAAFVITSTLSDE